MEQIADQKICFILDTSSDMKDDLLYGMCSVNPIDCTAGITYVMWSKLDDQKNNIFHYNKRNSLTNIEFNSSKGSFKTLLERLREVSFCFFLKTFQHSSV